jgi:EAL domain-containing protein (putative c-di-GMP-specific phosphodiesterase class I)
MERVRERVSEPIVFEGRTTIISASCGVALFPDDGQTLTELQRNADAALAKAKASGRGTFQFYSAELTQHAANFLELSQQLDRALERGELVLHYQPKVDLRTGSVCGVEALVRWQTPHGLVPPSIFVPVAEETGRIRAIGEWVIRAACATAKRLSALGFCLPVAINVSPNQFDDRNFLQRVQMALSDCDVPAGLIELEITESVLMRDFSKAGRALQALKALGVVVSLDDFGTGYSNLSSLSRLPLQSLKIDRSLVADLSDSRTGASILRALLALARELDMKVVAEGVENEQQLRILTRLNCDQIQGFFFSAPLPEHDLVALLREGRKLPRICEEAPAARRVREQ